MQKTEEIRVAIIATHPIQYHIPWFRKLSESKRINLTVYFGLMPDEKEQGIGFGLPFQWDIPMLQGYDWKLLSNRRRYPSLAGFFKSSAPDIYRVLNKERPDIVVTTGWNALPLLQALWACMRLGIPRIVRGESHALYERARRKKLMHRLFLSLFDAFLTIGKANRDFYLSCKVSQSKLFACPYFIDNERFKGQCASESANRLDLRRAWNIPEKSVCFVFAGKLEEKKRIMDLLAALYRAVKRDTSLHLLVVGSGALEREAKEFTSEKMLPVTFTGFLNQTEITKAYAASDFLVLPSDYGETWGLVVNEAMACGLPAIVSDRVGCGPDLIEDGTTGHIFPFGNIDALADRLVAVASDSEKRLQMSRNAEERIKNYSVEKAVEGTLKAIEYVLKDRL